MLKKIKNLTTKELMSICVKQEHCETCPLITYDCNASGKCLISYVTNRKKLAKAAKKKIEVGK